MTGDETYLIRRFYADDAHPEHRLVVRGGLSLEDAQAHCQDEATHERDKAGNVVWFDGYEEES